MPSRKLPQRLCVLSSDAVVEGILWSLQATPLHDKAGLLHRLRSLANLLHNLGLLEDIVEKCLAGLSQLWSFQSADQFLGFQLDRVDQCRVVAGSLLHRRLKRLVVGAGWGTDGAHAWVEGAGRAHTWVEGVLPELRRALAGMAGLVCLDMTKVATDCVMEVVGTYCHGLRHLVASFSASLTDKGMRSLCGLSIGDLRPGCRLLETLQLDHCPAISVSSVVDLFLNLPCLSFIAYERINEVFKSSSIFEAKRVYRLRNFEQTLTEVEKLRGCTNHALGHQDFISSVAAIFPHIRRARLTLQMEQDEYVENLRKFSSLEELVLDLSGHMGRGLGGLLATVGSRLTHLGLTLGEMTASDISTLSSTCTSLHVLHLFFKGFVNDLEPTTAIVPVLFPHLEGLYLGAARTCCLPSLHLGLTDKLLTHCRGLKTLYLSTATTHIDDQYLQHKLKQGSLSLLEHVSIKGQVNLGLDSYSALVKNCHFLKKVNMSTWNILHSDFVQLQKAAVDSNLDLELIGPPSPHGPPVPQIA